MNPYKMCEWLLHKQAKKPTKSKLYLDSIRIIKIHFIGNSISCLQANSEEAEMDVYLPEWGTACNHYTIWYYHNMLMERQTRIDL